MRLAAGHALAQLNAAIVAVDAVAAAHPAPAVRDRIVVPAPRVRWARFSTPWSRTPPEPTRGG